MTKTKKMIITIIVIVVAIITILLIPSAEFDYKVLGDKYKLHLYEKYSQDLSDLIYHYNWVYKGSENKYGSYYYNDSDSESLTFSIWGEDSPEEIKKITKFDGRKVYIKYTTIEYKGKNVDIIFEGTKNFFDVYSWKMVENELFPIKDDSVTPAYDDLEFAEK